VSLTSAERHFLSLIVDDGSIATGSAVGCDHVPSYELDVVLVTKLDRLGRSTRELLDFIERIGKAGASFRSLGDPLWDLGDPLWDSGSSQGRLLSTLLAAIAEFERDLIRERTGDGRKRAMANGVKFGRKPKLSDYQRKEALRRRAAGETLAEIARSYAVDISMISRLS
jgi:DNA invertase Pin-like site-specific DNA recombinase